MFHLQSMIILDLRKVKVILNVLMPLQIVHQLIERKQSEIRKVHPGLACFNEVGNQIDIKDIPGICKFFVKFIHVTGRNLGFQRKRNFLTT